MQYTVENAKVTSKGQITIPLEIRKKLGISAGDRISFVINGDIVVLGKSVLVALKAAQQACQGLADEIGIKDEEDIQKLVNEVRYGK